MSDPTVRNVTIVGGGVGGLAVAKSLADNGIPCTIVEQSLDLGGHVRKWACMATDQCLRCFACSVEDLVEQVRTHPMVSILNGWELSSVQRSGGTLERIGIRPAGDGEETFLDSRALVLATGFQTYDPSEKVFWAYGRLDGVMTLADADSYVRNDDLAGFAAAAAGPMNLAFFQCVGSRDKSIGANYCSQYCCKAALRLALRMRHERPDWAITIFYIDLQIAGKFAGHLLSDASGQNIRLVQGVPGEISPGPEGLLEVVRESEGRNIRESYHRIILSTGQRPSPLNRQLGAIAGLPLDEFGFLTPRSLTDSSRTESVGVYLAGTCAGPKGIEETLEHAGQTAAAVIEDVWIAGRTFL